MQSRAISRLVALPDWRHTTFNPDSQVWPGYIGDYSSSQPLHVYIEIDRLMGIWPGFATEFIPQIDTAFVSPPELNSLPEFSRHPDGSVEYLFHGQPLGIKQ